jgi:hypothetical protein
MADSMHSDSSFNPFNPAEPPRDEALAAMLRQATGDVPVGAVNWDALASRISRALPGRASTAWWSYAQLWERRMLPLAFAASLVGAIALWTSAEPASAAVVPVGVYEIVADVAQGAPAAEAARTVAGTLTADMNVAESESE